MAKASSKLAPVVAILNMKGGVGKTTISAHVMRVLYRTLRKKTLLIDFDPQFDFADSQRPPPPITLISSFEVSSDPSMQSYCTEVRNDR
jgi:hypothetical protein